MAAGLSGAAFVAVGAPADIQAPVAPAMLVQAPVAAAMLVQAPLDVPAELDSLESRIFGHGAAGPAAPVARVNRLQDNLGAVAGTIPEKIAALKVLATGMGL